jgi:hypothetical protein
MLESKVLVNGIEWQVIVRRLASSLYEAEATDNVKVLKIRAPSERTALSRIRVKIEEV